MIYLNSNALANYSLRLTQDVKRNNNNNNNNALANFEGFLRAAGWHPCKLREKVPSNLSC